MTGIVVLRRQVLLALGLIAVMPLCVAQQSIRLSTTTSTENSGLLAYLLPQFESDTGIKVKVIAVGTGKAPACELSGSADIH